MREAIDHNTVGYRISRARLNKGLTQKQLSEIVEVAQTYQSERENLGFGTRG